MTETNPAVEPTPEPEPVSAVAETNPAVEPAESSAAVVAKQVESFSASPIPQAQVGHQVKPRMGTGLTDNFLGEFLTVTSLTVVTPGGSSVTALIQGILEFVPPQRKYKVAKYTPLSGTHSGKEQPLATVEEASQSAITAIYEKVHHAALDAVVGINGSTLTLVTSDGATWVGTGVLSENAAQTGTDAKEFEVKQAIEWAAGWTYTPGT